MSKSNDSRFRAGRIAPPFTLCGKDGLPWIRNIDAWYVGFAGIFCHRIPEEPEVFTVSHHSGFRIGRSRLPSVDKACEIIAQSFADQVDFTKTVTELLPKPEFMMFIEAFTRHAQIVPTNMDLVKRIDVGSRIMESGPEKALREFQKPGRGKD